MDNITHRNARMPQGRMNSTVSIANENFDNEELMILKALPIRGRVDISDLSGKTLYPPSKIKGAVAKLEHVGVIISVKKISMEDMDRNTTLRTLLSGHRNKTVQIDRLSEENKGIIGDNIDTSIKEVELNYELSEKGKQIKHIVDKIDF